MGSADAAAGVEVVCIILPLPRIDSPPCPTSLSHLLVVILSLCLFILGVRGMVDVAGVDMAVLTCPGPNQQGVVDIDMVWCVVDVAWSIRNTNGGRELTTRGARHLPPALSYKPQ